MLFSRIRKDNIQFWMTVMRTIFTILAFFMK